MPWPERIFGRFLVLIAVVILLTAAVCANAETIKASSLPKLDGYTVKVGDVLDLEGKVWNAAKSISVLGRVVNGRINYSGPDHSGALDFPKTANGASAEGVTVAGRDYTGIARVWGQNVTIKSCEALPGSGWGVIAIDAPGVQLLKIKTTNTRRGGVYLGGDTGCDGAKIDDGIFIRSDHETLLRVNSGKNVVISDTFADNTQGQSQKEAMQLRGGSGVVRNCTVLNNLAVGQTPTGTPATTAWEIKSSTVYGYTRVEAGGELAVIGGNFVNRPTITLDGKPYTLNLAGGGYAFALQGAARGLPAAKGSISGSVVDAAILSTDRKPTLLNVKFNGSAINPTQPPATQPTTAPATQPAPPPAMPTLEQFWREFLALRERVQALEAAR